MSMTIGGHRADAVTRMPRVASLRLAARVFVPMIAQGVVRRRRRVARLATAYDVDGRSNRRLARLAARHGEAPLLVRVGRRTLVIPLAMDDAVEILEAAPEPFTPASRVKRAALAHFEPHAVLVSTGAQRAARRLVNEHALGTGYPAHPDADRFAAVVRAEVAAIRGRWELGWDDFDRAWQRVVRRIVLGDAATDDTRITESLNRLRDAANWGSLHPVRTRRRRRFQDRLDAYVRRPEPGSLAALAADLSAPAGVDPAGQVPHWLFAYDAAGITTFRTLAVAATHPRIGAGLHDLAFARACVHETLRLWPTTLVILRDTTEAVRWCGIDLPAGAMVAVPSSFLHRHGRTETYTPGEPSLAFSAGPARCPGADLAGFTAGLALTELAEPGWHLRTPDLRPDRPLPAMLDHFRIRLSRR